MTMNFSDIIVLTVIAAIFVLAVWYIRKEKKNGVQCIGCPDSKTCSGHCAGCPGNCSSFGSVSSKNKHV